MLQENDELVAAQELERQLKLETIRTDMVWLMSDPRGRRVIHRLLSSSGIYRSSLASDSAIYFNEGQRNVGLGILKDLTAYTPENYIVMLQEHMND